MNRFLKPAATLGAVGLLAVALATPSEARNGRNAAAIGAGVAGFAVGAAVGSAAANSAYYHEPYGYEGGYAYRPAYRTYGYDYGYAPDSYAYVPRTTRYDRRDPSSYYTPGGAYGPHSYTGWDNRERALRGGDW